MTKKNQTKWEIAKPILRKDYLEGLVTTEMKRAEVHRMRPEYKAVPIDNFGTNWNKMKLSFLEFRVRARRDEQAFANDRQKHPKNSDRWDGSEAQKLMKCDIQQGLNNGKKPKEFWLSRDQFQEWDFNKFKSHVWQEQRSKYMSNYWLVKKKKEQEKEDESVEEDANEQFFD